MIEVKFGQKLIQIKTLILNGIYFVRGPLFFIVTKSKTRKEKKIERENDVFCVYS